MPTQQVARISCWKIWLLPISPKLLIRTESNDRPIAKVLAGETLCRKRGALYIMYLVKNIITIRSLFAFFKASFILNKTKNTLTVSYDKYGTVQNINRDRMIEFPLSFLSIELMPVFSQWQKAWMMDLDWDHGEEVVGLKVPRPPQTWTGGYPVPRKNKANHAQENIYHRIWMDPERTLDSGTNYIFGMGTVTWSSFPRKLLCP